MLQHLMYICLFQATDNPAKVDDPAKDVKYAEPTIDNLRAQKDDVSGFLITSNQIKLNYQMIVMS
jgi:hypothetical protein